MYCIRPLVYFFKQPEASQKSSYLEEELGLDVANGVSQAGRITHRLHDDVPPLPAWHCLQQSRLLLTSSWQTVKGINPELIS
jgi:hypothetical protein